MKQVGDLTLREIQNWNCPKLCSDCIFNPNEDFNEVTNDIKEKICDLVKIKDHKFYDTEAEENECK